MSGQAFRALSKRLDSAPIPITWPRIGHTGGEFIVQMQGYGKAPFATEMEKPQGVGIVVHHPELELAADARPVDVHRGPHPVDGIRPAHVRAIAEDKPVRLPFYIGQAPVERQGRA